MKGLLCSIVLVTFVGVIHSQTLTPEDQARLAEEQRRQAEQTEKERQQLEQQYQAAQLAAYQAQLSAQDAEAAESLAATQWASGTMMMAMESGSQSFNDMDDITRRNVLAQLEMIKIAAFKREASVRAAGTQAFSATQLTNPFAPAGPVAQAASEFPACLALDDALGAVAVGEQCAASLCNGRVDAGDVPLTPSGSPIQSAEDAHLFAAQCVEPGRPLAVFRPSKADVVILQ